MTQPQRVKSYTPEEYYRLEHDAECKSDYYKGEIFAMSGGTARHSRISINISRELENRLEGGPCATYDSNLRLKILATSLRTYPDVSVYCDPLKSDEEDPYAATYTNPTVLFEILSESAEAYDRGFKSKNYRLIESLRAYVLVSQDSPEVEIYERSGDKWELREFKGLDAVLKLSPLKTELPLARNYRTVEFDPSNDSGLRVS